MAIAPPCAALTDPQSLLEALDRLADQSPTLEELLAGLLPTIAPPMNTEGGVVWLIDSQGNLRPAFQERWQALGLSREASTRSAHHQLVLQAVEQNGISILLPEDRDDSDLFSPRTFAFVPLRHKNTLIGVLELVFAESLPELSRATLQEILEACAGHVSLFQPNTASHTAGSEDFQQEFDRFLLRLYDRLDTQHLSAEAVGSIRDLLGVDRVSILLPGYRRPRIVAISGQAKVNRYSPVVSQLQSLAQRVLHCREALIQADAPSIPAGIDEAELADYLELTGAKLLAIVPLHATPTQSVSDGDEETVSPCEAFRPAGVLVVESLRSSRLDAGQRESLGIISDHLGNALGRAATHESIPLLPVLRPLGRGCRWLYLHQFWCCLLLFALATAGITALCTVSWDYRVTADGVLMPEQRRQVFAPANAEVQVVYVRGGDAIQRGEPLLKLVSRDLEGEEIRLRTIIQEKQTSLRALRVARETSTKAGETAQTVEIEGRLAEHRIELRHLLLQHEIVQERLQQLLITSPSNGVVATFQVEQLLQHRPVNRGDHLLDVMDPDSRWNLELHVEDRRLGHLLAATQQQTELPVEFVLATNPDQSFEGTLASIGCRSHRDMTGAAAVDLLVDLRRPDAHPGNTSPTVIPPLRIGAEVTAKVHCGRKPLGYVLFGDVIDFLRTQTWL